MASIDFGSHRLVSVSPWRLEGSVALISEVDEPEPPTEGWARTRIRTRGYLGTAFCIAITENDQAIFLTALHNVSGWIDSERTNLVLGIPLQGEDDALEDLFFYSIYSFGIPNTNGDLALLVTDLTSPLSHAPVSRPRPLTLWNPGEPQVGEDVYCLGFGGAYDDATLPRLIGSIGTVDAVYPERRDQRLDYPAVQTDCWIKGGMSGGPMMTLDGAVIAVASTGIGPVETDGIPATGYGALIAAAGVLRVPVIGSDGALHPVSIDDLWAAGVIQGSGAKFRILIKDDGDHILIQWLA